MLNTHPMSSVWDICGEDDKESKKHICISCGQTMFTGSCCGKLQTLAAASFCPHKAKPQAIGLMLL